jgi:WD40 repeat protein
LLIAGNDDCTICLWDTSRDGTSSILEQSSTTTIKTPSRDVTTVANLPSPPVLVHHIIQAHGNNSNGWIVNIRTLNDSRRFVSLCYGDASIRVWKLGQSLNQQQPIHMFHLDSPYCWTIQTIDHNDSSKDAMNGNSKFLLCGSENGWIQIFSME